MSHKYLRFPLALLRIASNEVDFFKKAASYAAVNAGYGFRHNREEYEFAGKLEEVVAGSDLDGDEFDEEAVVGASIIGITLGDQSGLNARKIHDEVVAMCQGSPLVTMKSYFFWDACHTLRNNAGIHSEQPDKRSIDWREFRVLCAIYSLPWNNRGFCISGLELLKCRALGFHNKEGFRAFDSSGESWPDHCLLLTERQIGKTVDRLEELRFFIRCRIGSGSCGGLTAYSIRHATRELLMRDCVEWQAMNHRATIQDNRREDREFYTKFVAEVKCRKVRLERKKRKTGFGAA